MGECMSALCLHYFCIMSALCLVPSFYCFSELVLARVGVKLCQQNLHKPQPVFLPELDWASATCNRITTQHGVVITRFILGVIISIGCACLRKSFI